MSKISIHSNDNATLNQLSQLANEMKDGDHLRGKFDGENKVLYTGSNASHNRARRLGSARREKFTNAKQFVIGALRQHFGDGHMADAKINKIINQVFTGEKRATKFGGFGDSQHCRIRGNAALTKRDLQTIIRLAHEEEHRKPMDRIVNDTIGDATRAIGKDNPTQNVRLNSDEQKEMKALVSALASDPQTRAEVHDKVKLWTREFANTHNNSPGLLQSLLPKIMADPKMLALFLKSCEASSTSENLGFLLEMEKLDQLIAAEEGGDNRVPQGSAMRKARHIFDRYVSSDNANAANLQFATRKNLTLKSKQGAFNTAQDFRDAVDNSGAMGEVGMFMSQPLALFLADFGLPTESALFDEQKPLVEAENAAAADSLGIDRQQSGVRQLRPPVGVSPQQLRGLINRATQNTLPQVPRKLQPQVFQWLQVAQNGLRSHEPELAAKALNHANGIAERAITYRDQVTENLTTCQNLLSQLTPDQRGVLTQGLQVAEQVLKSGDPATAQMMLNTASATIQSVLQAVASIETVQDRVGAMLDNYLQSDLITPNQEASVRPLIGEAGAAIRRGDNEAALAILQQAEQEISDYAVNNAVLDDISETNERELSEMADSLAANDGSIPYEESEFDFDDSAQPVVVSKQQAQELRNRYFFRF